MYHIPICPVCRENEVGAYCGSSEYCSWTCEAEAQAELEAYRCDYPEAGSYGISDEQYERQYDLFIVENV